MMNDGARKPIGRPWPALGARRPIGPARCWRDATRFFVLRGNSESAGGRVDRNPDYGSQVASTRASAAITRARLRPPIRIGPRGPARAT